MIRGWLAVALLACSAVPAGAEWQIKPFFGLTTGEATTFVDLDKAAGSPRFAFGVSGVLLGDMFGVESDFSRTPGFFSRDEGLVLKSGVTTLTGNIVFTLPRRLTEYTLRPYLVGGGGLMHVHIDDTLGALRVASNLPAMDVGGGVTGFLNSRVGLSWDVRYFRSLSGTRESGLSFGPEQLSFWRANMALAIRY